MASTVLGQTLGQVLIQVQAAGRFHVLACVVYTLKLLERVFPRL